MDAQSREELLRRVDRLERGYHWWRRTGVTATGVAVALLVFSAFAYSQRQPPGEVPRQAAGRRNPRKGTAPSTRPE